MNKEQPPGNYVMFLPTPITSPTEGLQNSQSLVSPSTEKHLLLSHATDVPLASTKQGLLASVSKVAKSDRPVLLQGVANPNANVLIPLTVNSNSPKIRWTVLEDQHTPGSVTNMGSITKKTKTVVAFVESKQAINMSQVNAEDKQKGKVLLNLEITKTLQKIGLIETKPNLPSSPTVGTHNPETPLCLVKFKTGPGSHSRQPSPSKPDGSSPSVESAEVGSSVLSTQKSDGHVLGTGISGPSESTTDKKEAVPSDEHERVKNLIPPLDSDVDEDVCQCEICGIVVLEKNISHHIKEHSVGSACPPPPPGPPCKKPRLI